MKILKSFIPDKAFVKRYLKITIPIILQQIFINSAIVVDNLMVGRLGQDAVVALGAINAIHFFFMFAMYGITHGAGIYVTQYNGANNKEKLIQSAAIKQQLLFLYSIITVILIWIFARQMTTLYIKDTPQNQNVINLAVNYYRIFAISTLFKAQNFGYSTTFQEIGQPQKGMKASLVSVFVNIVLNYFLIFGIGIFPTLGIIGAAYGTVISKMASFLVWNFLLETKKISKRIFSVIFHFDKKILNKILTKTYPLFWSEIFWVMAMMIRTQTFSSYGTNDFAAFTIQMNMENIVNVIWSAMWGGTIYLVGKKLGSNNLDHAEERALKLVGTTFIIGIFLSFIILALSFPMLSIYNVDYSIKRLTFKLLAALALFFPIRLLCGAFFFIVRAGGQTSQSMKIDLIPAWLIMVPVILIARYYFHIPILYAFIAVEATNIIKMIYAYKMFGKYKWLTSSIE